MSNPVSIGFTEQVTVVTAEKNRGRHHATVPEKNVLGRSRCAKPLRWEHAWTIQRLANGR